MGEHNLYIPTRELVRQDAYQAWVIRIQYACPAGWDPSVEDEMVANVVEDGREHFAAATDIGTVESGALETRVGSPFSEKVN